MNIMDPAQQYHVLNDHTFKMPAKIIEPRKQGNRYYTFERNSKFCVTYYYVGSTYQHVKEFETEEQRLHFVNLHLNGFAHFNSEM